jgi:hypothetical protein
MKLYLKDGQYHVIADNPSCNCDHWHYMFVKGSRKPKKFHHQHPHKAHKSRYAFHKHTAAQKASLRPV